MIKIDCDKILIGFLNDVIMCHPNFNVNKAVSCFVIFLSIILRFTSMGHLWKNSKCTEG